MADISLDGDANLSAGISVGAPPPPKPPPGPPKAPPGPPAGPHSSTRRAPPPPPRTAVWPASKLMLTSSFWVEVRSLRAACFKECSGLQIATATEQIKEGGVNGYVHLRPTRATQGNVTLKRGTVITDALFNWYSDVLNNTIERDRVTIYLYNNSGLAEGRPMVIWILHDALPVKYVAPSFRADESAVAVDSIEFIYGRLERQLGG